MARIAFASAVLVALGTGLAAAASSAPPSHLPAAIRSGDAGQYTWTVSATRGASGARPWRPCLRVTITHHHGSFSYDRSRFRGCLTAQASLSRSTAPLLVGGVHLANPGQPSMSVFAILTSSAARRVRVSSEDLPDRGAFTAPLLPLRGSGGLGDLRLGVIAIDGVHCIERVSVKDAGRGDPWASFPQDEDCGF